MNHSEMKDELTFVLNAEPDEFDLTESTDALIILLDAYEDLDFQMKDVPASKFQGDDYEKWFQRASYKKNRCSSAIRRFKKRIKELSKCVNCGYIK